MSGGMYKLIVSNTGSTAINKFTARIYADLSEVYAAGLDYKRIVVEKTYDQSQKVTLSALMPWDEAKKIYYAEVNWNEYSLASGATIEQDLRLRPDDWSSNWDVSNDYSAIGITANFAETQYIPIYRGNLKMWGNDPSKGSTLPTGYKISGYIAPDAQIAAAPKAGFKVAIVGTQLSAITDSAGYFEISDVPSNIEGYTLQISKPGFLMRDMKDVAVNTDVSLSTVVTPLRLWAGDIAISGVQDGAINMADIMDVAKVFNSVDGDGKYVADHDLNSDGAINMVDIMIVASHFNAVMESYSK
jgi:hypothetical protein